MSKETVTVGISIDSDLLHRITQQAEAEGRTRSNLISNILRRYLAQLEERHG